MQGEMNWYEGKKKCESIGMRLPTISEVEKAYESGLTKRWEQQTGSIWSDEMIDEYAFIVYVHTQNVFIHNKKTWETTVICYKDNQ